MIFKQTPLFKNCCCCSVTSLCLTLCNPMDQSTWGSSVLHYLHEFAQIHVHWVSDAISLILCHPLLLLPLIFPSIRVFSSEPALPIRWSKYWSFSFSISPSMNIQGWFTLGVTGLISLLSKGLSGVFSTTTIQKHQFLVPSLLYNPTLTTIHDYQKKHTFDYIDLCQ